MAHQFYSQGRIDVETKLSDSDKLVNYRTCTLANADVFLAEFLTKTSSVEELSYFSEEREVLFTGFPNFANKTFANGECPKVHWRKYSGLSPIGESPLGILAKSIVDSGQLAKV